MSESIDDWAPPGPGPWLQDKSHLPAAVTPLMQATYPPGMARGFAETLEPWGSLIDTMHVAFVNGFFYMQPVPFDAPALEPLHATPSNADNYGNCPECGRPTAGHATPSTGQGDEVVILRYELRKTPYAWGYFGAKVGPTTTRRTNNENLYWFDTVHPGYPRDY